VGKVGGDYTFEGPVVSAFQRLNGKMQFVCEDDRGVLHIFDQKQIAKAPKGPYRQVVASFFRDKGHAAKYEVNDQGTLAMHSIGDQVRKVGGDYTFKGTVVSVFFKVSKKLRYVAENQEGILHVFGPNGLEAYDLDFNSTELRALDVEEL
jgi:hypothetical protein